MPFDMADLIVDDVDRHGAAGNSRLSDERFHAPR